jgi:hypothetical protein
MPKALEQMNVKLAEVVSDISGLTGLAIMRAILAGEREPLQLAKFRNVNGQRTEAEIVRALYGTWRAEHLFALQQAVTLYDAYREQLRLCDEQMQAYLATLADQSQGRARPRRHGRGRRERRRNDPAFDVAGALFSKATAPPFAAAPSPATAGSWRRVAAIPRSCCGTCSASLTRSVTRRLSLIRRTSSAVGPRWPGQMPAPPSRPLLA